MPQLVINNFTRGQLDHDLNGRFDLPLYQNGFEVSRNFISNYKGNIKYRTGWQYEGQAANSGECVLMEFRFNSDQSYLLEFTEDKLRFYTYDANGNFGIVVDESPINEIPTLSSNSQDGVTPFLTVFLRGIILEAGVLIGYRLSILLKKS